MPGTICNGVPTDLPHLRETKAFCEGLRTATTGGLIDANPHPANSDDAANWARGFNAYNGGVGSASQVCCCDPVYDGVP